MMPKLDHIAFLVDDLDETQSRLAHLELEFEEAQTFESEGTKESYAGRLLFIQPVGEGPYARALEKRGPGLHHLALNVADLGSFMRSVEGTGWLMHPKSYATSRQYKTVWLARPGVGAMIEVHESNSARRGELGTITIAGLNSRAGLASIFGDISVQPGPKSGVSLGDELLTG